MRRTILGVALLLLVPVILLGVTAQERAGRATLAHVIDQTGDTAKVYKINQFTARDSFAYIDTIDCSGTAVAVTWTSHPTIRRIAVGAAIDTTYIDSITIDLGTNTSTIEYTVTNIEGFTRAAYIDTMVARINAIAATTDTVQAEDSATYILLRSKIAQDGLEGDARWTLAFGTDNNNMSESDSTFTTIKMVCDSVPAKINATATVNDTVTAANSGDTVYTVTGDRAGWNFRLSPGDSAQDTTVVTAAKASWSTVRDTIPLFSMYQDGFNALWGYAIIHASKTTTKGYGNADSAKIILYAVDGYGTRYELDSAYTITVPDTNWFSLSDIGVDTLFKWRLEMDVLVTDSATDTSGTRNHDVDYYFIVTGE